MTQKRYALITGASSGIGEEYARQLAARGWSLILVARSLERLEELRLGLMSEHPDIDIGAVGLDLAGTGAAMELFRKTQEDNLEVELLINNAGFGAFGEFTNIERERFRQMIDLNIAAVVELSHLYLQQIYRQTAAQRRAGGIINIASVAGFVPLPYCSVYAASKAFVRSFSHALNEEARMHGVQVMVVNPGTTRTNFFKVAGKSPLSNSGGMQTAAQVVEESLRAFDRGSFAITTGSLNRWIVGVTRLIPDCWIVALVGRRMREKS